MWTLFLNLLIRQPRCQHRLEAVEAMAAVETSEEQWWTHRQAAAVQPVVEAAVQPVVDFPTISMAMGGRSHIHMRHMNSGGPLPSLLTLFKKKLPHHRICYEALQCE